MSHPRTKVTRTIVEMELHNVAHLSYKRGLVKLPFPQTKALQTQERMEGLIPYIYRAIKRRKAPRYYRSMSTGASQWFGIPNTNKFLRPKPIKLGSFHEDQNGHRRQYSSEDFSEPPFSPDKAGRHGRLVKETRFGSSRFLACITGAN